MREEMEEIQRLEEEEEEDGLLIYRASLTCSADLDVAF